MATYGNGTKLLTGAAQKLEGAIKACGGAPFHFQGCAVACAWSTCTTPLITVSLQYQPSQLECTVSARSPLQALQGTQFLNIMGMVSTLCCAARCCAVPCCALLCVAVLRFGSVTAAGLGSAAYHACSNPDCPNRLPRPPAGPRHEDHGMHAVLRLTSVCVHAAATWL